MRVLPSGSGGVLVEVDDLAQVLALAAHLRAHPPTGVVDVVPAARTVLLVLDQAVTGPAAVGAAVRALPSELLRGPADLGPGGTGATAGEAAAGPVVTVPVVYDGADLDEVGALTGWGADGVVARHTATTWTVAFSGFAPGFAYCVADGGPVWQVPRRATPRTRVPAGSVALADAWTGVYPGASPGGWQLLGRTGAPLWDVDREPPALLRPGVRVRFVDAGNA
ncbi:5-oxoprolinase subunit B family protein [Aquipuribacter hungaricus]|uniref:Allophanate hydrolase subunit 1 n=2 Tax=Aquipuribacter hungaricus TaxID=545624 RepID=A0ABV7WK03_9MICO